MNSEINDEVFVERMMESTGVKSEVDIRKYILEYVAEKMKKEETDKMIKYIKIRAEKEKTDVKRCAANKEENCEIEVIKEKMDRLYEYVNDMRTEAVRLYKECLGNEKYLEEKKSSAVNESIKKNNENVVNENMGVINNKRGCMYYYFKTMYEKATLHEYRICYGYMVASYRCAKDAFDKIKSVCNDVQEKCEEVLYSELLGEEINRNVDDYIM